MPQPTLLSDIGNVLVTFDFSIATRRAAALCSWPAESLAARLETIKGPFENGEMDDATFVKEAMVALNFQGTAAEFESIWCEIFTENALMEHTLAAIGAQVPLLLLSNTNNLHKDYLLRTFPIFRHFQDGVYSYSAKCSKPDAAIFQHTISRFDLDPAQTFYIDDLEANIATARRLGFQAHLYDIHQHSLLEAELAAWLSRAVGK